MRRALVLLGVVLAGCGGAAPRAPRAAGELKIARVVLRPGTIGLVVANSTAEPATLAQVAVDDGFVAYGGPPRTVAPHTVARLTIPYPWIAGQGYGVKVLTSGRETLEYRIEP